MRRFATLTALPCLTALAITAAAIAQQPNPAVPGRPTPSPQPAAASDPNRPPMPIIDVEFPGGPLSDFVRAIQAAAMESTAKTPINVIIPTEATDIRITAISLKRVSAETALESLRYAFGIQGTHQLEARNMTNSGDEGLTFAIQYAPGRVFPQHQNAVPIQPVQSEAYSLRDLISAPSDMPQDDPTLRMSADSVLAALKLAAELEAADGRIAPTQLLFHPDTQLLIARGTPDQHRLISSVLAQLADTLEQRRGLAADDVASRRHAELQRIEMQAQMEAAKAQLDRAISEQRPAQAELERLEKLFATGSANASELERARAQLEVARANARAAESHAVMLQRRQAVLEGEFGGALLPSSERILAIYDLRDLNSFKGDFYQLVKQVIGKEGKMSVKPAGGDSTGTIEVLATRAQHEALVSIFNTARRLKANEPKLPGITLDQVLQKPKE
jgi:hypothetical protein